MTYIESNIITITLLDLYFNDFTCPSCGYYIPLLFYRWDSIFTDDKYSVVFQCLNCRKYIVVNMRNNSVKHTITYNMDYDNKKYIKFTDFKLNR